MQWRNELAQYLLDHEEDIAIGINDFDELRSTFKAIIGREPKEE